MWIVYKILGYAMPALQRTQRKCWTSINSANVVINASFKIRFTNRTNMIFWCSFSLLECQNAVRKSFVYLRKHLTFESLRDKLVEKNLLSDRERDDYVCMIPLEYAMIGKVIKLMIRKGRCMEFVDIIDNLPDHRHVMNKLNAARQFANNPGQEDNTCKIHLKKIYFG